MLTFAVKYRYKVIRSFVANNNPRILHLLEVAIQELKMTSLLLAATDLRALLERDALELSRERCD